MSLKIPTTLSKRMDAAYPFKALFLGLMSFLIDATVGDIVNNRNCSQGTKGHGILRSGHCDETNSERRQNNNCNSCPKPIRRSESWKNLRVDW